MNKRLALSALFALVAIPTAFAAQPPASDNLYPHANDVLVGHIYSKGKPGEQKLLFNFHRKATRDDSTLHVVRTYTYPDGRVAAVEKATYKDGQLAGYEMDEKQTGDHGSLKIDGDAYAGKGTVHFSYTHNGDTDTDSEQLSGPTVINETITAYIDKHWNELMDGKTVNIRYLVIPRLETVGFSLSKVGEANWSGRQVVNIKMDPSSFFIGLLVDPVYFTFDKNTGEFIQYTGRTTPMIKQGNDWKPLDAVSTFKWVPAK
ncbi:MAG TPA: hypothetical protein VFH85_08200 [Gammaproteobacteria bacterium]|nr:hypothetical protein [Gammaproteobacteria bacterium]